MPPPQESFFGHFKDETNIKECETLAEIKREIKSYMTYNIIIAGNGI